MRQDGTALLIFNVDVSLEDRGDCWAAYLEPPGMTVYGDTESAIMGRVIQALDSFLNEFAAEIDGVQEFRAYLDAHGVPSLVTTDAVQDDAARRMEYSMSMDCSFAFAAGA